MSDPLGEMLAAIKVSATQVTIAEFTAPWALDCGAFAPAFLFVSLEGSYVLEVDGADPITVKAGDVVLLTRPLANTTGSGTGAPVVPLDEVWARKGLPVWYPGRQPERITRLGFGGGGAVTRKITVVIELMQDWALAMMRGLPPVIHICADEIDIGSWLQLLVPSIDHETPGSVGVSFKIAELVFIVAMRAFFVGQGERLSGWLRAMQDPALARVVVAIQRAPGDPWTVEAMATEARLSRSNFCRRFRDVVDQSPHRFLSDWRLHLAADLLVAGQASAKEISRHLGYSSPSTFGQAFRDRYGVAPAQYRRGAGA